MALRCLGRKSSAKKNAGWVNFDFVCDFYGDDIYISFIFLRSLSCLCCFSPLLPFLQFLNTVASLACWVAKGAGHCKGGGRVFFPFPIELQASMFNIMCKSQKTSQNLVELQ